MKKILFFILLCFVISCTKHESTLGSGQKNKVTILVQPFSGVKDADIEFIVEEIKKIYPNVKTLASIPLPKETFYLPRNRYRADSLIEFLRDKTPQNSVTIGLTTKDISVTQGKNPDFGVMGLGYSPGKSCIASSFRLHAENKNEEWFKVAIHELGHTQGLPHCENKTCFMRDAEGHNPTNEEKDFCPKCKEFLKTKNWNF